MAGDGMYVPRELSLSQSGVPSLRNSHLGMDGVTQSALQRPLCSPCQVSKPQGPQYDPRKVEGSPSQVLILLVSAPEDRGL